MLIVHHSLVFALTALLAFSPELMSRVFQVGASHSCCGMKTSQVVDRATSTPVRDTASSCCQSMRTQLTADLENTQDTPQDQPEDPKPCPHCQINCCCLVVSPVVLAEATRLSSPLLTGLSQVIHENAGEFAPQPLAPPPRPSQHS